MYPTIRFEVWQGRVVPAKYLDALLQERLYIPGRLFLPFFKNKTVKKTLAFAIWHMKHHGERIIAVAGINHSRKKFRSFENKWFGSYVKPDFRGRGLAVKLLEKCFRKAGWIANPERANGYGVDLNLYDILTEKSRYRTLIDAFNPEP